MHKQYFPACPVDGPIDPPFPFGHMVTSGAVPNKCGHCDKLFEGECIRFVEDVGHYLHLDYGPCGINGPTDPVTYEDEFVTAKVEVPRKCVSCVFLDFGQIRGFDCRKDADKWGGYHRGLDWGTWAPDCIYIQLPPPKVTTKALVRCANQKDEIAFIKEHRRVNPGLSIQEARADFKRFREILDASAEKG
jgi:hypothetical protein